MAPIVFMLWWTLQPARGWIARCGDDSVPRVPFHTIHEARQENQRPDGRQLQEGLREGREAVAGDDPGALSLLPVGDPSGPRA